MFYRKNLIVLFAFILIASFAFAENNNENLKASQETVALDAKGSPWYAFLDIVLSGTKLDPVTYFLFLDSSTAVDFNADLTSDMRKLEEEIAKDKNLDKMFSGEPISPNRKVDAASKEALMKILQLEELKNRENKQVLNIDTPPIPTYYNLFAIGQWEDLLNEGLKNEPVKAIYHGLLSLNDEDRALIYNDTKLEDDPFLMVVRHLVLEIMYKDNPEERAALQNKLEEDRPLNGSLKEIARKRIKTAEVIYLAMNGLNVSSNQ